MATRGIDELVWAGLTDPVFREWLLDGHRREVLDTLTLTETERQAVLAVEADTLEAFAAALCRARPSLPVG